MSFKTAYIKQLQCKVDGNTFVMHLVMNKFTVVFFSPQEKIKPFFSETLSKESSYKMRLSFAAATASDLGFMKRLYHSMCNFEEKVPETRDIDWIKHSFMKPYEMEREQVQGLVYRAWGKTFKQYLTDCNKIHRRAPAQLWCLLGKKIKIKMLKVLHRSLQGNQQCSWKEANSFKENILTPMLLCET